MSKTFWLLVGTLLLVVVVTWIGVSLYDTVVNVEVNPNAEQHLKPIKPSFDLDVIDDIDDRTKNLPVSPRVIQELEYTGSGENADTNNDQDNQDQDTEN